MKKLSRRDFLKVSGSSLVCGVLSGVCTPGFGFYKPSIYEKHGFKDSHDYLQKGAPFIQGDLNDWQEDNKKQFGNSPYSGASVDLLIKGKNRVSHYMMSRHSGMVKAALQSNIGIPKVHTLLHFDSHDDIHLLTWKTIPPVDASQKEIHDYSEKEATYGGWINPLSYLSKFKKVVHITNNLTSNYKRRKRTLYVSKKNSQFQLSFEVPSYEIVRKIEWVELVKPSAEMIRKEIGNESWSFSVCNDFYVPNYNHVVKNSPRDVAVPISIKNDVVPFIKIMKQLPSSPVYAASNISPNYTASPYSFQTCKFIELNLVRSFTK